MTGVWDETGGYSRKPTACGGSHFQKSTCFFFGYGISGKEKTGTEWY